MPFIEAGLEGEKDIGDVEVVGAELEEMGDVDAEEGRDDEKEAATEGNRGAGGEDGPQDDADRVAAKRPCISGDS